MTLPKDVESYANNPPPVNKKQPPALYRYACEMYEAMLEESEFQPETDNSPDGGVTVYEGYIGKTYARTGGSIAYQGWVTGLLKDYNCIAIILQGSRNTPTRAVMVKHPSEVDFPDAALSLAKTKETSRSDLTDADRLDSLEAQIRNLAARVGPGNLPNVVAGIASEFQTIRERLDRLEHQGEVNAKVKNKGNTSSNTN